MTSTPAPARCLGCDAGQLVPVRVVDGYQLWRCPRCDLVFHEAERSAKEHAALFDSGYFTGSEPDGYADYLSTERAVRRQARTYLRWIEAEAGATGSLFDAGCATGFFMDEARLRGWTVRGCDPSAWASAYAREHLALEVETAAFEQGGRAAADVDEARYDAVTFVNVLEHCSRPGEAIRRAWRMLRAGGILFVETWERDSWAARLAGARWHQWSPQRVTSWFNRRSLASVVPATHWDWRRYAAVARWLSLARGLEVLGWRPPRAAGGILVPYPLRDLVVLLARKR